MNSPTSLIVYDKDDLDQSCTLARKIDDIKRIKLTTASLNNGRLSMDDIPRAKELLQGTNTEIYVGGGITDTAIEEGRLGEHIAKLQNLGINTVEVGNPSEEIIQILQSTFETVLGEVGGKLPTDEYARDYSKWERSLKTCIDNGLQNIVLEGSTGQAGIYTKEYNTRTFLLMQLMKTIQQQGYEGDTIIEASKPKQQSIMYSIFGPNIHLGNIFLEAYRLEGKSNIRNISKVYSHTHPERVAGYYELLDYLFQAAKKRDIDPNKLIFDPRLTDIHGIQVLNSMDTIKHALDTIVPLEEDDFGGMQIIMVGEEEIGDELKALIGAFLQSVNRNR